MLNTQIIPQGPKVDNTSGATGLLDASEYNDTQSELNQMIVESGQILSLVKTPYQESRSMTLHGMNSGSWLEDSATATANLSNLIPMNSQTWINFSTAFITGNVITLTINATPLGGVTFATSNANTYALLKTQILAAYPSATVTYSATYNYISIYQAGTTFTVTLTVTGGASQPNSQVSYGNTTPDSYAEMDGVIISFNKSIANTTTTPQINIASGNTTAPFSTTASMLGAITVVQIGGAALIVGSMSGFCEVRLNLSLNSGAGLWELLYSDGLNLQSITQKINSTNYFMNGTGQVAQKGTSYTIAASPTYTLDRIKETYTALPGTSMVISQGLLSQAVSDELPLLNEGARNYIRSTVTGTNSPGATDFYKKQEYIENGAVMLCGGRQVTITFKARSSISQKIGIGIQQYYGTGGSPSANTVLTGTVIALTTTFAQYSYTFTTSSLTGITLGSNNDNALIIEFYQMWGSTINTNNLGGSATTSQAYATGTMDITEIRVNLGVVSIPFLPIQYGVELESCRRYGTYLATLFGSQDNASHTGAIIRQRMAYYDANTVYFTSPLLSKLRTNTIVFTSGTEVTDWGIYPVLGTGSEVVGFTLSAMVFGDSYIKATLNSHGLTDAVIIIKTAVPFINADY